MWKKLVGIREGKFLSVFYEYSDSIYQASTSKGHACDFIRTHITMWVISPCVSHDFIVNEAGVKEEIYESSSMAKQ